jgi:hypothetical protein
MPVAKWECDMRAEHPLAPPLGFEIQRPRFQ